MWTKRLPDECFRPIAKTLSYSHPFMPSVTLFGAIGGRPTGCLTTVNISEHSQPLPVNWHGCCVVEGMYMAASPGWQFKAIEFAVRIRTPMSGTGQAWGEKAGRGGGPSRNRTGVHGFAIRCVTTPPSGLAGEAFGGSARRLSTGDPCRVPMRPGWRRKSVLEVRESSRIVGPIRQANERTKSLLRPTCGMALPAHRVVEALDREASAPLFTLLLALHPAEAHVTALTGIRRGSRRFDEWRRSLPWRRGSHQIRDHLKHHCISGIQQFVRTRY